MTQTTILAAAALTALLTAPPARAQEPEHPKSGSAPEAGTIGSPDTHRNASEERSSGPAFGAKEGGGAAGHAGGGSQSPEGAKRGGAGGAGDGRDDPREGMIGR